MPAALVGRAARAVVGGRRALAAGLVALDDALEGQLQRRRGVAVSVSFAPWVPLALPWAGAGANVERDSLTPVSDGLTVPRGIVGTSSGPPGVTVVPGVGRDHRRRRPSRCARGRGQPVGVGHDQRYRERPAACVGVGGGEAAVGSGVPSPQPDLGRDDPSVRVGRRRCVGDKRGLRRRPTGPSTRSAPARWRGRGRTRRWPRWCRRGRGCREPSRNVTKRPVPALSRGQLGIAPLPSSPADERSDAQRGALAAVAEDGTPPAGRRVSVADSIATVQPSSEICRRHGR